MCSYFLGKQRNISMILLSKRRSLPIKETKTKRTVLITKISVAKRVEFVLSRNSNSDIKSVLPGRPVANGGDGWYHCPRCTNCFLTNALMLRHYRTHCDPNETRFQCPYCNYGSKYSSNVYKHVRRVHKQMPCFKPQRMY